MSNEKVTKPTVETVLERLVALEERMGIRLDRIESVVNATRAEMLDLRADFREVRTQFREHFPATP